MGIILFIIESVFSQERVINNFASADDYAIFYFDDRVKLDFNDYIYLEVANNSGTNALTLSNTD